MKKITRRGFLNNVLAFGAALAVSPYVARFFFGQAAFSETVSPKEASHYDKVDDKTVRCNLCPHGCVLKNGQRSFCRVREPRNGRLYTLVYELPCTWHNDPIEKKPIYHMLPGTYALSIATAGCNLRCKFCQNWQISQSGPEDTANMRLSCKDVVRLAHRNASRSIAYTYSEPTIFYEYMIDTAMIAQEEGLKNIAVTAGYINPAPLKTLCRYIDAANVDLKAFNDNYLREVCAERLEPLLTALKIMKEEGVWVEITNLIVPTLNDDMDMIGEMCLWIRDSLGKDTPLHFSRFWPMYKLKNLPPTPVETLERAREVGVNAGLSYVYIGNVPQNTGNNTYCPGCKRKIVDRMGYVILDSKIRDSRCSYCNYKIAGIWET